ncbi:site-specific integrase [Anabaena sp. UHCC 0253]|uniref:tyrosine-type recombinase/integrase n=1 Tax=Anabaena sp. UHCC 0253 TaxID=2590019 RepID=UPI0014488E0E|nr:site-specific integrase [Anabaena sp. UHCC 0253]MTJ54824.1 site-specific integrase [Anabaena sp. UHCC 0253]
MEENLGFIHLSVNTMRNGKFITYQLRLSSKYGRKTIGVGGNYLTALNIAKTIDEEINRQLSTGNDLDIAALKSMTKGELSRFKESKHRNIRVVEKNDLQMLWSKYVDYNKNVNTWCESTILTTVATVTSIINSCPVQKLEQKGELVKWFFSDKNRCPKTSKDRLKWIVSAIDWNSKHGNIPKKWGIEYRDLLESIKLKDIQRSNFQDNDNELDIFSVSEVYSILDALKNETYVRQKGTHKQYYFYVYFLWLTGCRPSEAVALKWENIDFEKNRIKFCENQVNASGTIVKKQGTKTVDFRFFPINQELREIFSVFNNRTGYVFTNKNGKCISQQALNGVWKNLLAAMNLRYRVPYQLRHTMISYHANNDYPIHKLAEIVGNSEKIIKEYYLKLDIEKIFLPDVIRGE